MSSIIVDRYREVIARIRAFEKKYSCRENSVKLIAVSKNQPIAKIEALVAAGQYAFGENYLQEALPKINSLSDCPLEWHFIGKIQSNKTRIISENFSWVHGVDRFKIAERLNEQRPTQLTPLNLCIEVNISASATKSGVEVIGVENLAAQIIRLPRVVLRGLMVIPDYYAEPEKQYELFHAAAQLQQKLIEQGFKLDTLSMGMSADFEMAIKAGSNMVRIGTSIFGERDK